MDSSNSLLSKTSATAQVDLCAMLIAGAAAAMETPEGREALEKGRQEYIRHREAANQNRKETSA